MSYLQNPDSVLAARVARLMMMFADCGGRVVTYVCLRACRCLPPRAYPPPIPLALCRLARRVAVGRGLGKDICRSRGHAYRAALLRRWPLWAVAALSPLSPGARFVVRPPLPHLVCPSPFAALPAACSEAVHRGVVKQLFDALSKFRVQDDLLADVYSFVGARLNWTLAANVLSALNKLLAVAGACAAPARDCSHAKPVRSGTHGGPPTPLPSTVNQLASRVALKVAAFSTASCLSWPHFPPRTLA